MAQMIQIYRALRSEEYPALLTTGLLPPCTPCPNAGTCCAKTISDHINAGSRAVEKSRYISTTLSEGIAAAWCANTTGTPKALSATYAVILIPFNQIIHINQATKTSLGLGIMAYNSALASQEVIVPDVIRNEYIVEIRGAKIITKREFEDDQPYELLDVRKIIGTKKGKTIYLLTWRRWPV